MQAQLQAQLQQLLAQRAVLKDQLEANQNQVAQISYSLQILEQQAAAEKQAQEAEAETESE